MRKNEALRTLNEMIKDFVNTVPLIATVVHRQCALGIDLAKNLLVMSPYENKDSTVGDMLALELHKFANEVEELSIKVRKRQKWKQLADLNERWGVVDWFVKSIKIVTMMLKIKDDDFEMLENDQLTVQSMMGSRYLATSKQSH